MPPSVCRNNSTMSHHTTHTRRHAVLSHITSKSSSAVCWLKYFQPAYSAPAAIAWSTHSTLTLLLSPPHQPPQQQPMHVLHARHSPAAMHSQAGPLLALQFHVGDLVTRTYPPSRAQLRLIIV